MRLLNYKGNALSSFTHKADFIHIVTKAMLLKVPLMAIKAGFRWSVCLNIKCCQTCMIHFFSASLFQIVALHRLTSWYKSLFSEIVPSVRSCTAVSLTDLQETLFPWNWVHSLRWKFVIVSLWIYGLDAWGYFSFARWTSTGRVCIVVFIFIFFFLFASEAL